MSDPLIWAIISSLLLKCLRKSGHRAAFKYTISRDYYHLVGYFFEDDSTIIQVAPTSTRLLKETSKLAQKGINIFEGEAKETGGQVSAKNKNGI